MKEYQPDKRSTSIVEAGLRLRRRITSLIFTCFLLPKEIALKLIKSSLPGSLSLAYSTLGDAIIMTPLIALLAAGIRSTLDRSPESSGHAAWYAIVATLLIANKSTSALSLLLGQSWERVVPYHHVAAYIAIVNSILHGYTVYVYDGVSGFEVNDQDSASANITDIDGFDVLSDYSKHGDSPNVFLYLVEAGQNFAGTVMTFCIIFLVLTSSIRWFRKTSYNVWLGLHIFFFVGLAASSLIHAMSKTKFILIWWLIDVSVRHIINPNCCSPDTAKVTRIMPDIVEIRFNKCLNYCPGQFIRIAIGSKEFHPVTISSAPHEDETTVHLRVRGAWTQRLLQIANDVDASRQQVVSVQGPFGNLTMDLLDDATRYPHVILLCGGIGVTPMRSLARHMVYTHNRGQRREKIHLVWVVPDPGIVDGIPILQDTSATNAYSDNDFKHISPEILPDDESVASTNKKGAPNTPPFHLKHISMEFRPDDEDFELEDDTEEMTDSSDDMFPTANAVFQSDIFITQSKFMPLSSSINTTYHYGRPDLYKILSASSSSGRVAVVACGPKALVESAKYLCREQSTTECAFDFHEEIFDY